MAKRILQASVQTETSKLKQNNNPQWKKNRMFENCNFTNH